MPNNVATDSREMVHYVISDEFGNRYYFATFEDGLFEALPWRNGVFDCIIFTAAGYDRAMMEDSL